MASIEGGGLGGIGVSVAGVGSGVGAVSVGPVIGGGFGGMESLGGVRGFGEIGNWGPAGLSAVPDVGGTVESLADFKASVPINYFGAKLTAPVEPIVGDRAESSFNRKNTILLGTITFNTEPEGIVDQFSLNEAEVLTEAQTILGKPELDQAEVVAEAEHWLGLQPEIKVIKPQSEPIVKPEILSQILEPKIIVPIAVPQGQENLVAPLVFPRRIEKTVTQKVSHPQDATYEQTQNKVSGQTEPEVFNKTEEREETEEEIEEQVINEDPNEELEDEEVMEKRLYLEDQEVSAQRRVEVRFALIKARAEADRLGLEKIPGSLVAKFLPPEHEGNRSQVVKKTGPDGSYQETVEAIAGISELGSDEQAVDELDAIVIEKKPVKLGEEGKQVADEDVARVYKYYHPFSRAATASIEVKKRIIKKTKQVVPNSGSAKVAIFEKPVSEKELSLEELNPKLAEVFSKAA